MGAFHGDFATMGFDDGLGDGQPQARVPLCGGASFISPVKALKEMG